MRVETEFYVFFYRRESSPEELGVDPSFSMNVDLTSLSRAETDLRIYEVIHALEADPWLRTSQLAGRVGLGSRQLRRLFTKEVGVDIRKYSLDLRLRCARHLLITTWRSIKEVRNEAGIPNGPDFVCHFKKRFLMTPSAYRKAFHVRFDEQMAESTNKQPLQPTRLLRFTASAGKENTPV